MYLQDGGRSREGLLNPKPKKERKETRNQKGLKRAEKQATRPHDQGRLAKKKLPDRRADILYLRRKNPTQTPHKHRQHRRHREGGRELRANGPLA